MPADRLVPSRNLEEPCARCHHTAGQHHVRSVRTWEYCLARDCLCPGWCSTIECATCDYGTPRWAGYSQCLACLDYHVKPCDYVYKSVVGFDAEAAIAAIRQHRSEWEVTHPGWHLELDQQRIFPETVAPSKYVDRQTTLGRKLFGSRFRVIRAHRSPRVLSPQERWHNIGQHLAGALFSLPCGMTGILTGIDAADRIVETLQSDNPLHVSGGDRIDTPIVYAKDDPHEEESPGVYRSPLDWKSYSVSIPLMGGNPGTMGQYIDEELRRVNQQLQDDLVADMFADGWEGIQLGEERYDATCDHCGGFWDGMFTSQDEADQWLVQHRAVCLSHVPPSLAGE